MATDDAIGTDIETAINQLTEAQRVAEERGDAAECARLRSVLDGEIKELRRAASNRRRGPLDNSVIVIAPQPLLVCEDGEVLVKCGGEFETGKKPQSVSHWSPRHIWLNRGTITWSEGADKKPKGLLSLNNAYAFLVTEEAHGKQEAGWDADTPLSAPANGGGGGAAAARVLRLQAHANTRSTAACFKATGHARIRRFSTQFPPRWCLTNRRTRGSTARSSSSACDTTARRSTRTRAPCPCGSSAATRPSSRGAGCAPSTAPRRASGDTEERGRGYCRRHAV